MPDPLSQISFLVAQYIRSQRDTYSPAALPLTLQQKDAMRGFFSHELLDTTRLLTLTDTRIPNPEFYPMLRQLGFTNVLDFSDMAAITFENVIVSHEEFTHPLLFHELVHVEQYRQLGVEKFAELYVKGFLEGGGYQRIPLEIIAYALQARYERDPEEKFAVEGAATLCRK